MKNSKLLTNLILGIIVLTIGFGCKSINIPSFSGGGGSGISESSDPKTAIQISFKKFMEAKFYHSVVKTKNAQAEVETEVDFNAPDRFWIKNKLPNMKSEVIAIGNDSYNRLNEGKWTKLPVGQSLPVADMRGKMTEDSIAAMKDFEFVGKENVNGKDTLVYKYKSSYGGESSSKMWILEENGLPLKVETEGSYANNKLQMTITYDFEKETKIEVPKVN